MPPEVRKRYAFSRRKTLNEPRWPEGPRPFAHQTASRKVIAHDLETGQNYSKLIPTLSTNVIERTWENPIQ